MRSRSIITAVVTVLLVAGGLYYFYGYRHRDISSDFNAANRSVTGRTVETMVTISDPFQAQRAPNPAFASQTYRTIFTLNRDIADP